MAVIKRCGVYIALLLTLVLLILSGGVLAADDGRSEGTTQVTGIVSGESAPEPTPTAQPQPTPQNDPAASTGIPWRTEALPLAAACGGSALIILLAKRSL
jgi:hypothetical protein